MKLKEIKHCMAICCTNIEQVRELDKKMKSGKCFEDFLPFPCYILTDGKKYYGCVQDKNFISSKNYNPVPQIVNFSDLIIPEMSAEDALLAYDQMCRENYCCSDCPIYGIVGEECTHEMDGHITEIIDAIKKWKYDHEKRRARKKSRKLNGSGNLMSLVDQIIKKQTQNRKLWNGANITRKNIRKSSVHTSTFAE